MATTMQRIARSEINRPGPTVSRSLILGLVGEFEQLFCLETKTLPEHLRGQGDFTPLSRIREKQEAPIIAAENARIEARRKDDEEIVKNVRLSEYRRQIKGDEIDEYGGKISESELAENGGLDYGNVDEELVMGKYLEFAAVLVDAGVLSADDCQL